GLSDGNAATTSQYLPVSDGITPSLACAQGACRSLRLNLMSMGRGLDHPARLQNIAEHGHAARPFLAQQLTNSYEQVVHLLEQMSQDDLQKMGTHIKYGPQTLAVFIQHFIIEHDQAHVKQVKTLLAQHRGDACTSEQQNS